MVKSTHPLLPYFTPRDRVIQRARELQRDQGNAKHESTSECHARVRPYYEEGKPNGRRQEGGTAVEKPAYRVLHSAE